MSWADTAAAEEAGGIVVYAAVLSYHQRADLGRQVARLAGWATTNGHQAAEVLCEVGSWLSGKRPKLRRVLSDPCASVVVVENGDRLARFRVGHLEAGLAAHGRRIVVADPGETTGDLVRDMIEVLTSMCGRRGARSRAMRAVTGTGQEPGAGG